MLIISGDNLMLLLTNILTTSSRKSVLINLFIESKFFAIISVGTISNKV